MLKSINKNLLKTFSLLLLYVYFSLVLILATELNFRFLDLAIFFFAFPAFYFLWNLEKKGERLIIESAVTSFFVVFIVDLIAHLNRNWYVPSTLGIRVLNVFPIEQFFWVFFFALFTLSLYEHFFDKSSDDKMGKSFKILTLLLLATLAVVLILYVALPQALQLPFFYIQLILILALITIIGFLNFPEIAGKISLMAAYLFLPTLAYELAALELGHWCFSGENYIGYVLISGKSFPLEEFFFLPLVITSILVIHEVFVDNRK